MTKSKSSKARTSTTYRAGDSQEVVNQPTGAPIAPEGPGVPLGRDVASHMWQRNSAAINTNELAGYSAPATNVLDSVESPEKEKAREEAADQRLEQEKVNLTVQRARANTVVGANVSDYDFRTTLDVSNPLYINPSLNHHKKAK